jgi:hypothetical protein
VGFVTPRGNALPPTVSISDPDDRDNTDPVADSLSEAAWPVVITTDEPCYDPDIGLRLHIDQPFSAFLSKLCLSVTCSDSQVIVNNGQLRIAFHRTLRVPDDGRTHLLPKSFGRFPVQNFAAHKNRIMKNRNASLVNMAHKGGVFLPIFQREALWISFEGSAKSDVEYKVRVFQGGVNVVTGRKWNDARNKREDNQDYVLVPPQKHLDGIAISNGVVRQFVAMPIGSGYSIEKQITGKEDVGGLQIEISPQTGRMYFSRRGSLIDWQDSKQPETVTPKICGLDAGQLIHLVRDGTRKTAPFLNGSVRRQQKKTFLELVNPDNGYNNNTSNTVLTALYNVSLYIKVPGILRNHKITTQPFSPLTVISKIARATRFKGKTLINYDLWYNDKVVPANQTLLEIGLVDGGILVAKPKRILKVDRGHAIAPTLGLMIRRGAKSYDPPEFPDQPTSQQQSPTQVQSPPQQQSPPQRLPQHGYLQQPPQDQRIPQQQHFPTEVQSPPPQQSSPQRLPQKQSPQQRLPQQGYPPQKYQPQQSSPQDQPTSQQQSSPQRLPQQQSPLESILYCQGGDGSPAGLSIMSSYSNSVSEKGNPEARLAQTAIQSWAMGLAPGGKLAQQIHKDEDIYRPKHCPTALICIQLLNAVAYEAITGLVCPSTPITVRDYVNAGFPWFDTYDPSSRSTAGGVGFDRIRSVSDIDGTEVISAGTNIGRNQKIACTICHQNLCDCVLRQCNHAFCSICVKTRMRYQSPESAVIRCAVCGKVAERMLGFSAPMALPGEEESIPNEGTQVVFKTGSFGKTISAFELSA